MPGPRSRMKVTARIAAVAIQGQLLGIGIGDSSGPRGILVPRSQLGDHRRADEPPKVEAAADRAISIHPWGFKAPAMHARMPPTK
jgi:hypothetical protein